jgi:transcriptional regulator with XRE-family HTH domain
LDVSFFGARLQELRRAKGLTQAELAARAGLSKGGVANLEQGLREPAWATVVALAEALKVDCQAFLQRPGRNAKAPAKKKRG